MRDINEILPKIPNMKWGALTNRYPTNNNVKESTRCYLMIRNGTQCSIMRIKFMSTMFESGKRTKRPGLHFPSFQPFWAEPDTL